MPAAAHAAGSPPVQPSTLPTPASHVELGVAAARGVAACCRLRVRSGAPPYPHASQALYEHCGATRPAHATMSAGTAGFPGLWGSSHRWVGQCHAQCHRPPATTPRTCVRRNVKRFSALTRNVTALVVWQCHASCNKYRRKKGQGISMLLAIMTPWGGVTVVVGQRHHLHPPPLAWNRSVVRKA